MAGLLKGIFHLRILLKDIFFQVRAVAEERLVRPVGTIGRDQLLSVKAALKIVFGW